MGYMHIENLYREQEILQQERCFALEKIHGTSTHVAWQGGALRFHAGGVSHDQFAALFPADLASRFAGLPDLTIYGEGCGGKCMKMSHAYGKELRFIAFDVQIDGAWLSVPAAAQLVADVGLDFVAWEEGPCTVAWLDAQRDLPSSLAEKLGLGTQIREGVVVRPLLEMSDRRGKRLIVKHKRAEFAETATPREVDPARQMKLLESEAIAKEWATEMRLTHVLDKMGNPTDLARIPDVIAAMVEDVEREATGEIVPSKDARRAIGSRTALMFKKRVTDSLRSPA